MLTCTAQVVAEHLEHGHVTLDDAKNLRKAASELETEVQHKRYVQPTQEQQRMLWGD